MIQWIASLIILVGILIRGFGECITSIGQKLEEGIT